MFYQNSSFIILDPTVVLSSHELQFRVATTKIIVDKMDFSTLYYKS